MQDANTLRKRIIPLIFLGLLVSFYLSHHHIEVKSNLQIGTSICSFDEVFDCDSVARSVYSETFGIPVAFFGAFFYSSLLLLFLFTRDLESAERKSLNSLIFLALGLALLGSLFLAYKSYFDLGKVCLFCSLLYITNIALFGLFFFFKKERGEIGNGIAYFFSKFLPSINGLFFILGNIGLVLLVVYLPKVYERNYLIPRYLAVYDKSVIGSLIEQWKTSPVELDQELARELPGAIIREPSTGEGEPIKPITIVEYADYECPFCQKVAPVLEKIYAEHQSKVRLVLLQFPLDKSCNKSIEGDFHQNSCKVARGVLCAGLDYGLSSLDFHSKVLTGKITDKEPFEKLLADYGIDEAKCTKADQALKEQIDFAIAAGIHSTPSIFIEGKKTTFTSFPQIERVLGGIIEGE